MIFALTEVFVLLVFACVYNCACMIHQSLHKEGRQKSHTVHQVVLCLPNVCLCTFWHTDRYVHKGHGLYKWRFKCCTYLHMHIHTHTHTHRTNMTNTWYKLFNIISTHKKRTCILSCSVRSLTITHAGTYFARNDNNYTTLLISPFNTSQSLQQTKTRKQKQTKKQKRLSSQFSTELKVHKNAFQCIQSQKEISV